MTAFLTDGTKGCGSICAVTTDGEIIAVGEGESHDTVTYAGTEATMIDLPEVKYE